MVVHSLPRARIATVLILANLLIVLYYTTAAQSGPHTNVASYTDDRGGWFAAARPDGCNGWNPLAPAEDDPPACFRAKQFRQIQRFRVTIAEDGLEYLDEELETIDQIERCALGIHKCPVRPLIVTDWYWAWQAKKSTSGEAIWLSDVLDEVKKNGYAVAAQDRGHYRVWRMINGLDLSLHMFWTSDRGSEMCFSDPRCVRPEDYRPSEKEEHRHDLDAIPAKEIGVVPAWRIMTMHWWGLNPQRAPLYANKETYTYHPLGAKWHMAPFEYPGHTWIPLSIQRRCLATAAVPYEERTNTVIILAKRALYFRWLGPGFATAWPEIIKMLKEDNITLVTYSNDEDGVVPPGLTRMPQMSAYEFGRQVASAKAMLAIGSPGLSPSPYISLCQGAPVVMPSLNLPLPTGWKLFDTGEVQSGPVQVLGEPWVFNYKRGDWRGMVRQIKKAVNTPIEPFVPPENTYQNLARVVHEFLNADWEAAYHAFLATQPDGVIPRLPIEQRDNCYSDKGWCYKPVRKGDYDDQGRVLKDKVW